MKFFGRCNISRTFVVYNDIINTKEALKGVLSMRILQTIDLKKYYGTEPNITRALDGVNFSVNDGEFVAVEMCIRDRCNRCSKSFQIPSDLSKRLSA